MAARPLSSTGSDTGHSCEQRIHIFQGEYRVTDNQHVVFTTLLGSCVAACLRDPEFRIGGMNHFLLPGQDCEEETAWRGGEAIGVHLMELLVNGLLRRGARRERLEAKLFGGARIVDGLEDIGARNAEFAARYLRYEGIRVVGGSLGGTRGRRIQYWPSTGRARQIFIAAAELSPQQMLPERKPMPAGSIEFF